jgi:hypothetical protein
MRRASIVVSLSLALLSAALLTARTAEACSCIGLLPPVEAARDVDVVFHGKLVAVADLPKDGQYGLAYKMFTFDVLRTFKGQLDAQVNIKTTDNEAACGRSYGDPGSEWLIYARVDDNGQTQDNLCSRTMPIANAAADIAELEAAAGTLDQPNPPPVEPGPAEPEPAPIVPDQPDEPEGPAPAKPGKKGCSVTDETAPVELSLLGLGLGLGLMSVGRARRRR